MSEGPNHHFPPGTGEKKYADEVLGVPRDAGEAAVRQAKKELSKHHHEKGEYEHVSVINAAADELLGKNQTEQDNVARRIRERLRSRSAGRGNNAEENTYRQTAEEAGTTSREQASEDVPGASNAGIVVVDRESGRTESDGEGRESDYDTFEEEGVATPAEEPAHDSHGHGEEAAHGHGNGHGGGHGHDDHGSEHSDHGGGHGDSHGSGHGGGHGGGHSSGGHGHGGHGGEKRGLWNSIGGFFSSLIKLPWENMKGFISIFGGKGGGGGHTDHGGGHH